MPLSNPQTIHRGATSLRRLCLASRNRNLNSWVYTDSHLLNTHAILRIHLYAASCGHSDGINYRDLRSTTSVSSSSTLTVPSICCPPSTVFTCLQLLQDTSGAERLALPHTRQRSYFGILFKPFFKSNQLFLCFLFSASVVVFFCAIPVEPAWSREPKPPA